MNLFRIAPAMPVSAYKTFQVAAPVTQWRTVSCEDFGCSHFRSGWKTTAQNAEQADYIRRHSGRTFEEREPNVFYFAPGQPCFDAANHRLPLERNEIYIARAGDWRGNPEPHKVRRHTQAVHWVEEFAEHQDWLTTLRERG